MLKLLHGMLSIKDKKKNNKKKNNKQVCALPMQTKVTNKFELRILKQQSQNTTTNKTWPNHVCSL